MSFTRNQTTINSEHSSTRKARLRPSADATNPSLELPPHVPKEGIQIDSMGRPVAFLCRCDLVKHKYLAKKYPDHACGPILPCQKVFTSIQSLIDHLDVKYILCQHEGCNTIVITSCGAWMIFNHLMNCHTTTACDLASLPHDTDMETLRSALFAFLTTPFYNSRTGFWQLDNPFPFPFAKKSDISTETVQAAIAGAVSGEAIPAAISSTVDEAEAALPGGIWHQVGKGNKKSKPVVAPSPPSIDAAAFPDLTQKKSTNLAPLVPEQSLTKTQEKKLKKLRVEPASSLVVESKPVGEPASSLVAESKPVGEPASSLVVESTPVGEPVARTFVEFVNEKIATQKQAQQKASTVGNTNLSKVNKLTKSDLDTVDSTSRTQVPTKQPLSFPPVDEDTDYQLEEFCFDPTHTGEGRKKCPKNHHVNQRFIRVRKGHSLPNNVAFCINWDRCKNVECNRDHPENRVRFVVKERARIAAERLELESAVPTVAAKLVSSPGMTFDQLLKLLKFEQISDNRIQMVRAFFKNSSAKQEKYDQLIVLLQIENVAEARSAFFTAYNDSTSS
jgi:hypothetical protein